MNKEEKFHQILEDIFAGARIEGKGGFVNLMKIKHGYYSQIKKILDEDIKVQLSNNPKFRDYTSLREEIFNKLYSFFSRYFSENGSIYFNSTPFHNNIYEKVYTQEQDVSLFWKTNMLYYVKTDSIFRSIEIDPNESDDWKLFFDVSDMEQKKANEKKSVVYIFKNIKDGLVNLEVGYSKNGKKTDTNEILKSIKKEGLQAKVDDLEHGFNLFEKQTKVDYFINKNAREFLMEQFKLWSYQYFWQEDNAWTPDRIEQLRLLKIITYKIIDFISQFENELGKIWNKPKFVRKSNYVITLDRITDKKLVEKIIKHSNFNQQLKEWQLLSIVDKKFNVKDLSNSKYAHLPIDTKYFPDLKLGILSLFNDLDNQLDGWLIKSENYQALNTILPKFKEKVQLIYIDPPFNTGKDFDYIDKFRESTWLTLMSDRISVACDFLKQSGSFYLHLDHNADHYGRMLMNNYLNKDNFQAKITWNTGSNISGFKSQANNWIRQADFIHFYSKNNEMHLFNKIFEPTKNSQEKGDIGWLDYIGNKDNIYYEQYDNNNKIKKVYEKANITFKAKGTIWNDIYSFQYSEPRITESFSFSSSQKPENLLRRIIQSASSVGDMVFDFFLGVGTTIAVAHKLSRKWVGVDMGEHFSETYYCQKENILKIGTMGRMKIVVSGDKEFRLIDKPDQIRKPHLSKDLNWNGGGFFKYYELEQYEDTLSKCKYADSDVLDLQVGTSPYQEYVFMKDEKMTEAITIDYKNNKVKVDLNALYPDIDIAETLSNLKGKNIKKITANEVEFTDNTKINTQEIDYKDIKPLIWWE